MMDNETISKKIAFVSNTSGTTLSEVMLIVIIPLLSFMIHLLSCYSFDLHPKDWKNRGMQLFIDQVLIVLPTLLALTILSDHILLLNGLLLITVLTLLYLRCGSRFNELVNIFQICVNEEYSFLTNYKACMQITTCICILAVDFNVFPRRFAKAELYGVGVMDLGVGTYIFSMGLTSTLSRSRRRITMRNIYRSVYQSSVLVFLGLLRVMFVKSSNYQEHISEYGLHWNFFFTLATVKSLGLIILYVLPWFQKQFCYLILSITVICCYQYALSAHGLADIIQHGVNNDDSRLTFFDANREGITSCIGYLSLYFAGLFFGTQLFKQRLTSFNKICWLSMWFLSGTLCLYASITKVTPVCRLMVNISYYTLQITINSLVLLGFLIIETITKSLKTLEKKDDVLYDPSALSPNLCQAISHNLLVYFLVGNALTGLVNIFIDVLGANNFQSFLIIIMYMLILNFIIWSIFIFQK